MVVFNLLLVSFFVVVCEPFTRLILGFTHADKRWRISRSCARNCFLFKRSPGGSGKSCLAFREFSSLRTQFPGGCLLFAPFIRGYGACHFLYGNDETEFSKKLNFLKPQLIDIRINDALSGGQPPLTPCRVWGLF